MLSPPPDDAPAILITGSSSGIGEATALELHRRGFRVFAGVRCEADGQRLIGQTSSRLVPVILDVTDSNAIGRAADKIAEHTHSRGLAGLVNNAGITVAYPLEFVPIEQLRQQLEVNVIGQLAVTQAVLPMLRRAQWGRVVNVSSISGLVAGPYVGAYAASKHAFEALSDSLRVELRHFGIRISIVEPAEIDTPIWEKSRQLADRMRDEMLDGMDHDRIPAEDQEIYRNDFIAMRAATSAFAANAMPASRVVRAIVHALSARRPKTRYRVGMKTWGVALVLRHLPDRLRDWIVLQTLGMR